MRTGYFYFIEEQFFEDFNYKYLMHNHEEIKGKRHDRPCFYAFEDLSTGLFWLIPLSSQVEKFREIYNKKVAKSGKCDTIVFGEILGSEKAFLIQNMFPIIPMYIRNEYIDKRDNAAVKVEYKLERELIQKAKRILALQRKGYGIIFPDVISMERELLKKLGK